MGVVDEAVAFARAMAEDDTHGYDQTSRWGPDYDCSSLVISAFKKAGVPLFCTYTGNMRRDMLSHGFRDVTGKIALNTNSRSTLLSVFPTRPMHWSTITILPGWKTAVLRIKP